MSITLENCNNKNNKNNKNIQSIKHDKETQTTNLTTYDMTSPSLSNYVIYVLKCENDMYYVGKTHNFPKRYDEHLSGKGSFWTKLYKPVEIIEIVDNNTDNKYIEDIYVWKYMEKYGIENVSGGSYSQPFLSQDSINCAKKHIQSSCDLCYLCNKSNHFIKECPENRKNQPNQSFKNNKRLRENDDEIENENKKKCIKIKNDNFKGFKCIRCGRKGHLIQQCFAKTHIKGKYLGVVLD